MTVAGAVSAAVLTGLGYKADKNKYGIRFCVGRGWGGISLGPVAIVNENPSAHILEHEFGHAVQNCFLGPFFIVLVGVPSMIRYWYREYLVRSGRKTYSELPPYDSIWFEGTASSIGKKY